jgi:hypothetical protein
MPNYFIGEDKDIEVRKCGDTLIVNLTVPLAITLPAVPFGGSFTLPPIALEFRGLDGTYKDEMTATLPSGWKYAAKSTNKPAWVRTWIQQWTAGTSDPFKFAGTLSPYQTATYTPPPG